MTLAWGPKVLQVGRDGYVMQETRKLCAYMQVKRKYLKGR